MKHFSVLMWMFGLLMLYFVNVTFTCNPAEYQTGNECCPMCSPGNRVYRHCTEYTSTSCVPCFGSTYLDEPNGLLACIPCTHCDPGFGLRVKQPCRPSSDTVCETLEGFYCTDPTKDGCKAAQRHSRCKPGQYIRQNGTTSTDTECVYCTGDTYSDGSFTSCQPHTQCDTLNRKEIKPGTHHSDSECGPETSSPTAVIVICVVVTVALIAVGIGVSLYRFVMKRRLKIETQGSGNILPLTQNPPIQVSDKKEQSILHVGTDAEDRKKSGPLLSTTRSMEGESLELPEEDRQFLG